MPYPGTASPGEGESSTIGPILPSQSAVTSTSSRLDNRNVLDRRQRAEHQLDAGSQVDLQVEELHRKDRVRLVPPKGWLHFVAGGVGGMCGAIVTSPLDVVKTRLQSDLFAKKVAAASSNQHGSIATMKRLAYHFVETGHILRSIAVKEGPRALFKGLGPTLMGVVPARSINFYTYGNGKLLIADHFNGGKESPAVHLLAAACAGIVTATATNPIWVVKTRMQLESHSLDRAIQANRHAAVRRNLSHSSGGHRAFTTSVKAAMASHAQSTAMNTAKGTVASSSNNGSFSQYFKPARSPSRPGTNSLQMTLRIIRSEGVTGLYKGMSASYLGVAEGTIQWTLYEKFKSYNAARTTDLYQSGAPNRVQQWSGTVGAAGAAKMLASLITYPHEVIASYLTDECFAILITISSCLMQVLRTRLRQEPEKGSPRKYKGLLQTFRVILKEEGAAAFYGGLSAHLLRVVPVSILGQIILHIAPV